MLDRVRRGRKAARPEAFPEAFSGGPAAPSSEPTASSSEPTYYSGAPIEDPGGSTEVSGGRTQGSRGPARRTGRPTSARRPRAKGSILTWLLSALARLWSALNGRVKLAVVLIGLVLYPVLLNVAGTELSRLTGLGAPPPLAALSAPADPAKAWVVTKTWQGSGNLDTEPFTVEQSWRVDWIFTPGFGGALQVYIYHADSKTLMNLAVTSQKAGTDTSFWVGAGKYFLRVNSTTGEWKIAVQDQR